MNFQAQLIHNLKLRSRANQERLQSEITLVFLHPVQRSWMQQEEFALIKDRLTTCSFRKTVKSYYRSGRRQGTIVLR